MPSDGCSIGTPNFSFIWDAGLGPVTFALGGDYSLVGAFLNYSPSAGDPAVTIAALASDGSFIATYNILSLAPIVTPAGDDQGAWLGISSDTNNIAFLQLNGDDIVAHSLEVGTSTPEPGTSGMTASALAAAALILRRSRAGQRMK